MVSDFSSALNINLSTFGKTFINKDQILVNNKLPKQNASSKEWDSFRKGIKKELLGDKSLLYDLSMTNKQRDILDNYLRANILFAKCLHMSERADIRKFENSLITLPQKKE